MTVYALEHIWSSYLAHTSSVHVVVYLLLTPFLGADWALHVYVYMRLHFLLCSLFLMYNKPDCVSFFPGMIVSDSDHFHNKMHIWPEGYTAFRKFASVKGICSVPDCHQACMKFGVPFWNSLLSWVGLCCCYCSPLSRWKTWLLQWACSNTTLPFNLVWGNLVLPCRG